LKYAGGHVTRSGNRGIASQRERERELVRLAGSAGHSATLLAS